MPRLLQKAALCQCVAVLFLLGSLFCRTAIPYLLTLGLGSLFLVAGLLMGLVDLIAHWRQSNG